VILKGITGSKSTQIRLNNFLRAPNVTKSYQDHLESCRAESMPRLFVAEHYSTVWKHATVWKIVKNCVSYKKRGKLRLRCSKSQNVDWKKIVGRQVCWPRPVFSAHAYWERVQDEKL